MKAASLAVWTVFAVVPAFPQDVAITEILAAGGTLDDEDGDSPDWIEIQNRNGVAIDLEGWYLTDNASNLTKWRFPAASIPPGGFLVVFASGKDRAVAGSPLHTNFQLTSVGEFLALTRPDGRTVADALAPAFPEQYDDISYGLVENATDTELVPQGASARYIVPTLATAVGWQLGDYDDDSWGAGPTGIGFDSGGGTLPPPGGFVNIAPEGTATQSSDYAGGQFSASLATDGEYDNFTHTEAGQNLPATWELDLGGDRFIQSIVLHNRKDCCRSRLRDVRISILDSPAGAVLFESDLLNPENVLGGRTTAGPESLTVDLVQETGGTVRGRVVRVVRTPDPDLSGTGGAGNEDEPDVLSLSEVEVFEGIPGFLPWIETDVGASMESVNASLYVRIPFDVTDLGAIDTLRLRLRYDDGFVAYLNGQEVARGNAPAGLAWNAAASAERPDAAAVEPVEVDITTHAGLLRVGTNLLAVHALNVTSQDDDFLILPELIGRALGGESWAYFRTPTPGAPNGVSSIVGFVADTKFSHDRGFYETPFDLTIETLTPGATITYTLDGSPPEESAVTSFPYTGPIRIARTSTVRARAFKAGLEPTNVDTHTYIFLGDVVQQTRASVIAAGFPDRWGGYVADYGFDPKVIGPGDLYGGIYAATIREDLKSLPTISVVMRTDELFGPSGIYTNSTYGGIQWERAASVELIHPDGDEGFQVDCGIRIQGGYFRSMGATRKHSFRLLFKEVHGPAKLRFPLLGPRAADRFDTITLRAGANDGYSWDAARLTEQYTRDEFGRSLQVGTGNAGSRGMFVHLYLNGIYWGLYNPAERPDHSFSASYYGGEKEDWDALHDDIATNGDNRAWDQMLALASSAQASLASYMRLQGRNPDGTRNPDFPHLLDVQNYVDYLIVNLWGGNWDWPWKNWWAGRDRTSASTGFKFYCWDYENTMGNNWGRSPLSKNALQNSFTGAGRPHTPLSGNAEYRLLFADRAHRFLKEGGLLTPESLIPRYEALAARVERSIVTESARWGDQHYNPPLTLSEWTAERNWILNSYLPFRTDVVLGQLQGAGLYPGVEAPQFHRRPGLVEAGARVAVTAPQGTVYYTLDGTDPRLIGGAVSPKAEEASAADRIVLLPPDAPLRLLVPPDASLGLTWTDPDFADEAWAAGRSAVGFDEGSTYGPHIQTDVLGLMNDISTSIYLRIPFDVEVSLFEGGAPALAALFLGVKYDDGYVAYLNGVRVASRNAPDAPSWDSRATASHADNQAIVPEEIGLEDSLPLLRPGRNVLAVHALNLSVTSSSNDFLIEPRIEALPAGGGIPVERTTTVLARALVGSEWSALAEATFIVDLPLRITEIMYHPVDPPAGSPFQDGDLEFVELQNVGEAFLDLNGIRITGGIEFDFDGSPAQRLAPGEIVVIVKDLEAFATRYPDPSILVAGEYGGRLDNMGDFLVLLGPAGEALLDFDFDDRWIPETDGLGPSLVIDDAARPGAEWALSSSWRASGWPLGSPGIDESGGTPPGGWQRPGDLNQDGDLDIADPVAILVYLFLGDGVSLPCGEDLETTANRFLLDANGDAEVGLSDSVHLLQYLFLGGIEHILGTECARIPACPDVCR